MTATIAGHGATIDLTDHNHSIQIHNSSITIRDFQVTVTLTSKPPGSDLIGVIEAVNSSIDIANMASDVSLFYTIYSLPSGSPSPPTIRVRNSVFSKNSLEIIGALVIDRCVFKHGGPVVTGSAIVSNSVIIADTTSTALSVTADSSVEVRSDVFNNTFYGGTLISDAKNSFYHISNNILYNLDEIRSTGDSVFDYNLVMPDLQLSGTGNTTGDPLFVDLANEDFHLRPGSPAINAADPNLVSNGFDFDGTPRPQGGRSDIGAFEYAP